MIRTEEQKKIRKENDYKLNADYKIFYENNSEIEQICKICNKTKKLSEFLNHYTFRYFCNVCHAALVQKHRKDRPDLEKKRRFKNFRTSADHIKSQKVGRPCLICNGSFPPCAMDFNHLDHSTKICNIAQLYGKSKERIDAEIAKCELICANCHRDKTQSEGHLIPTSKNRKYKSEIVDTTIQPNDITKFCNKCSLTKHENDFTLLKKGVRHTYCRKCLRSYNNKLIRKDSTLADKTVDAYKDNKSCTDCKKLFRYWILDFDHVSGDKKSNINLLTSIENVLAEISKCELVCVCCHRKRTHRRKLQAGFLKGETLTCECLEGTSTSNMSTFNGAYPYGS